MFEIDDKGETRLVRALILAVLFMIMATILATVLLMFGAVLEFAFGWDKIGVMFVTLVVFAGVAGLIVAEKISGIHIEVTTIDKTGDGKE